MYMYVGNSLVCALTSKTKRIKPKAVLFSLAHFSYCLIDLHVSKCLERGV